MHRNELASLIQFHRKRAGLTQSELAGLAGVGRTVIQDLESGAGRTSWERLASVLAILNLRLEPEGPLVEMWRESQQEGERRE